MAKFCKIAGKITNCTDHCPNCIEEETKTREIEVGDKVRYIGENAEEAEELRYYPPKGTIGVVVRIEDDDVPYLIKWPEGTTKGDGFWYVSRDEIELVCN